MAKSSFRDFIDHAVEKLFSAPEYNADAARKKLIASIETTISQVGSTEPTKGRKAFSVGNHNVIRYAPQVGGKPLLIDGKDAIYVPGAKFPAFLEQFRSDVEAGELDAEIKAALEGEGGVIGGNGPAAKSSGGTRAVGDQSKLNIGVAARRRANPPPSFEDIRKSYIDGGADPAMVDVAIEKRKKAEAA